MSNTTEILVGGLSYNEWLTMVPEKAHEAAQSVFPENQFNLLAKVDEDLEKKGFLELDDDKVPTGRLLKTPNGEALEITIEDEEVTAPTWGTVKNAIKLKGRSQLTRKQFGLYKDFWLWQEWLQNYDPEAEAEAETEPEDEVQEEKNTGRNRRRAPGNAKEVIKKAVEQKAVAAPPAPAKEEEKEEPTTVEGISFVDLLDHEDARISSVAQEVLAGITIEQFIEVGLVDEFTKGMLELSAKMASEATK